MLDQPYYEWFFVMCMDRVNPDLRTFADLV